MISSSFIQPVAAPSSSNLCCRPSLFAFVHDVSHRDCTNRQTKLDGLFNLRLLLVALPSAYPDSDGGIE